jgi:hypothetical protein
MTARLVAEFSAATNLLDIRRCSKGCQDCI